MMDSQWITFFDAPPEGDRNALKKQLGGKGAGLAAMSAAGFRVPPGFTLSTEACRIWVEQEGRWPEGLEAELFRALARLEQQTGRRFGKGADPLLVSVRSGAAVSMPGMMDTLLNCGLHPGLAEDLPDPDDFWRRYREFIRAFAETVHGVEPSQWHDGAESPRLAAEASLRQFTELTGTPFPTDPMESLRACVTAVFASWNSERAQAYRRHHGLTTLAGTAVNVQMMWPSQVSGITFTRDPNAVGSTHMVIEAAFGLGEAVVSGEVTPDLFHVDRDGFSIVHREIGVKRDVCPALGQPPVKDPEAQSLDDALLRDLSEICLKLERWIGHPLDIEWGWVDGEFAILQSRPIHGLKAAQAVEPLRQREIARLKKLAGKTHKVWVTHNLDETLRGPRPLTWDLISRFMSGEGGFGRLYRDLGYQPSAEVMRNGFLERICGRIYADPERLAGLFFDGLPMRYDVEAILADRRVLDSAPGIFDPQAADERFLIRLPRNLAAMRRTAKNMKTGRKQAAERWQRHREAFLREVASFQNMEPQKMDDAELVREVERRRIRVMTEFAPESLRPGFFGGIVFSNLVAQLTRLMGGEGADLARVLTSGLENDTTIEQDQFLYDVAMGRADRESFLRRYGHRCVGEMELATPRWSEDPSYIDQSLARLREGAVDSPEDIHRRQREVREEAEGKLPETLKAWGGLSFLPQIQADLQVAQRLLPCRESGKHVLMQGYASIREILELLAQRWELGGDIYDLTLDELPRFPQAREALLERIEERKILGQAARRLDMPEIIDSQDLDSLGLEPDYGDDEEVIAATPVAPGIGLGTVHIVFEPSNAGDLPEDAVLVCPSTDPAWTPLFMRARALVVERGGVLSHGAIVARNLGIPAVVCPGATKRLTRGERIRVDGQKGTLRKLGAGEGVA